MLFIRREPFGTLHDSTPIDAFTLQNANGVHVRAITYGAIITSIVTPDRHGALDDITLGFDRLDGYLGDQPYFGAVVGRYGNRIARGRFVIDGTEYKLATNNGSNHLHGGIRGFDKYAWDAAIDGDRVVFTRSSADGEEGYPGQLDAQVSYCLTDQNELVIDYEARTTKPTHVNLTQHSYFNLKGEGNGDVRDHIIEIDADRYTPVDATLIPTGELATVEGTPFDFRSAVAVGARIAAADAQIRFGSGYDHNWVLNDAEGHLRHVARVVEPSSGRMIQVATTEPGMQFYTGNFLDGTLVGKSGRAYQRCGGFCLETQHFPDTPNQPNFPSTLLRPGGLYRSTTIFTFGVTS